MKLEEGDFKGAVCLAALDESLAAIDNHILTELQRKHPSSHTESSFPPQKVPLNPFVCTEAVVVKAICSFPVGSASGPDGMQPQFLKDLLSAIHQQVEDQANSSLF
jgi:hypothetical protein